MKLFHCEGKLWHQKPFYNETKNTFTHKTYPIYWCRGAICAERNQEMDLELPLEQWTINEISNVLNISVNEDILSLFAGWCNRMNEILNRLDCKECGHLLKPEPYDVYKLGYYAVPLFKCVNSNCPAFEVKVRMTHCINGNCIGENQTTIDSRDCPSCSNNWLVCQDCFACCPSHHDGKILSCKKCGSKMKINKDLDWICSSSVCDYKISDEEIKNLKKFWSRSLNYEEKIREIKDI